MAETIKELQVKYTADTSELGQATNTAKTSMAGLVTGIGAGIVVLNQMQQLFGTMTRALGKLSRAAMETVNAFAEFSEGMAEVSTLIDVTDAQMADLTAGVMDLSGQFGARQTEQTRALYNAISAGAADAGGAVDFLADANRAAIAGVTDVDSAVRVLSGTINAYGLSAEDATNVSDILFSTVRAGVLTFSDLSSGLGRVTSVAATAGIPLTELTAALAALTKSGLKFDEATTSLRQIMISFINPTKDAVEVAEGLGIELSAAALKSKGLGGALADVTAKAGGNTEALIKMFNNIRAFAGAAALAGKQADTFAAIIAQNENAAGATQEAYRKMSEEVAFTFRQIRAEWENFKITVGKELEPLIRLIGDTILDILREISDFIKENKEEIDELLKAAKAVSKVAGRTFRDLPRHVLRMVPGVGPIADLLLFGRKGKIDEEKVTKEFESVARSVGGLFKHIGGALSEAAKGFDDMPEWARITVASVNQQMIVMRSETIAEFKKVTVAFGKEWQKRIQIAGKQLKTLVSQEKAAIDAVNALRETQKSFVEGLNDDIVDIELSGLDEVTRFQAQVALARSEIQRAAVENQKGNLEESIRIAERARNMFIALANTEIETENGVAVAREDANKIAIDGLEAVRDVAVAGFDEQQEVAEGALSRIRQNISEVKDELKDLRKVALESVSNLSLTISTDAARQQVKDFTQFVRNQFAGLGVGGLAVQENVGAQGMPGGGADKGAVVNNFNINGDAKTIAEEIQRLQRRGALEPTGGR